jgi:D-sedoheptulose 7-phosphate isomerase
MCLQGIDMKTNFDDISAVLKRTKELHSKTIEKIAHETIDTYKRGGKLIVFGNGGSYADALHFAAELEGAYMNRGRPALSALVPSNESALTAIANDFGYESVFQRFVEANAAPGDIVIGITTSGNSPNVIAALESAGKKGAKTVAFTGAGGGKAKSHADILLDVPSDYMPYIQIAHSAAYHIICETVESELFK